ncbi:hypothetical protein [Tortoise microvirus 38]|nr:hypothetical protein [Tortoise microvirus 38]
MVPNYRLFEKRSLPVVSQPVTEGRSTVLNSTKAVLLHTAIRTILPALMGAVGALVATLAPIYHNAFCGITP